MFFLSIRKKYRNVLKPEQNDLLAVVRGEPLLSSCYNIGLAVIHSDNSKVTYHTRKNRSKRMTPPGGATSLDDHSQGENEDDTTTLIVYNSSIGLYIVS